MPLLCRVSTTKLGGPGQNWVRASAHRTLQSPKGDEEASAPALPSSFFLDKNHPGKGRPGAILQYNPEKNSSIDHSAESTSSANSWGSLFLHCMLAITKGHVTMFQTHLTSTTSLLPAKHGLKRGSEAVLQLPEQIPGENNSTRLQPGDKTGRSEHLPSCCHTQFFSYHQLPFRSLLGHFARKAAMSTLT